ncbi:DUF4232 domain-containing protein [Streptomyces sp. NPDC002073]
MQHPHGARRTAAAMVAAAAVALMTGCTPTGDEGAAAPSNPPTASAPAGATGGGSATGGSTGGSSAGSGEGSTAGSTGGTGDPGKSGGPSTEPGPPGAKKPCTIDDVKVSDGHQADVRPPGTGTGAAIVSVTNTSSHLCTLRGFPTVAGAGNGSPDHNTPLATTNSGTVSSVPLAPGAKAWTKLTFVNVQGEADGYCVSGSTPVTFPTIVLGVPGAGAHQIPMDDGVFAECDNKVTVTPFSATKPT